MNMQYTGCSDTQKDFIYRIDGDVLYHSDFRKHEGIVTAPDFADPITFPGFYDLGVNLMEHCKANLAATTKAHNNPKERTGNTYNMHKKTIKSTSA